jgi:hypothetical protein
MISGTRPRRLSDRIIDIYRILDDIISKEALPMNG